MGDALRSSEKRDGNSTEYLVAPAEMLLWLMGVLAFSTTVIRKLAKNPSRKIQKMGFVRVQICLLILYRVLPITVDAVS